MVVLQEGATVDRAADVGVVARAVDAVLHALARRPGTVSLEAAGGERAGLAFLRHPEAEVAVAESGCVAGFSRLDWPPNKPKRAYTNSGSEVLFAESDV